MTVPRAELAEMAAAIRAEGATYKEIAETLGLSFSYVSELVKDPKGEKVAARRLKYVGVCKDCGGRTNSGGSRLSERCRKCAVPYHPRKLWDRETVVLACKEFAERYGRPPNAPDWNPPDAIARGHEWRADRFREDGCWPNVSTVIRYCGTWNAMIEAAGFAPSGQGCYQRVKGARLGAHLEADRRAA